MLFGSKIANLESILARQKSVLLDRSLHKWKTNLQTESLSVEKKVLVTRLGTLLDEVVRQNKLLTKRDEKIKMLENQFKKYPPLDAN